MPTGYTADITDKTTLAEFTLRCARNFGALILMRDDPMDAPIPKFQPSEYHVKALEDAQSRLAAAKEMTAEQAAEQVPKYNTDARTNRERQRTERDTLRGNYRRMIAMVEGWQPPTADHVNLKKFMLQQLKESIEWDCPDDGGEFSERCYPNFSGTLSDWIAKAQSSAAHDVEYHAKELAEEVERTNQRNRWVKQLRDSLKP